MGGFERLFPIFVITPFFISISAVINSPVSTSKYDLGLRIHRTKEIVLDIEHGKAKLPNDFAYLNYIFKCGHYKIADKMPAGTTVETFNDVPYVPAPSEKEPCSKDDDCSETCVIQTCDKTKKHQLIQRIVPSKYRTFTALCH